VIIGRQDPLAGLSALLVTVFELSLGIWQAVECLVKTFNRGEDEKNDVSEINELHAETEMSDVSD
jgi:hypothetical protein